LTQGITVDVIGRGAAQRLTQRQALFGIRLGELGDKLKIGIFENSQS
jgi:hypothetical protein